MVFVEELARLSSVPHSLTFDVRDQDPDFVLPAWIPAGFCGSVEMAAPRLLVEVRVKSNRASDHDYGGGDGTDASSEDNGTLKLTVF